MNSSKTLMENVSKFSIRKKIVVKRETGCQIKLKLY